MNTNIVILLNPSAGRGRALRKKAKLEATLRRLNIDYQLQISDSEDHLCELARQSAHEYVVIVGVGGDTTFNIIVTEILRQGRDNTFGVVPLGSSDDITREFGITNLETACNAIKQGGKTRIDVGCLQYDKNPDQVYFLGTASIGLGTTVNEYVEAFQRKYPILSSCQFVNGVLGIKHSFSTGKVPVTAMIEYNGMSQEINPALMVFYNTSYYASGLRLCPNANPSDGKLNACLVNAQSTFQVLCAYIAASKGKQAESEQVELLESEKFRIQSDQGVKIQTDGEVRGPYREIELCTLASRLKIITSI